MPAGEALTVTALGMVAVFIGLVLCIVFIDLFRRVARRVSTGDGTGEAPEAAAATDVAQVEPVPADVLAVIVAVLEVERALYVGRYRARLTLRRPAS